jgi:glutathione S-transferase
MITLIGYLPAWGLPDISPFVTKVDCYLRMVGLEYRLVRLPGGDLTKTPKGKLPVIKDAGKTVADSDFIIRYLKQTYGDTLDAPLSPSDKAVAVAFARMLEESFYWYVVQMRYRRDEDFKIYDPLFAEFLDSVPPEVRSGLVKDFRERILNQFYGSGKGRHTPEEVELLACAEFDAISTYLGDKPFFMGQQPTSVDATLYPWLIHTMRVPFHSAIGKYGNALPNLVEYCDRMRDRYYADFASNDDDRAAG